MLAHARLPRRPNRSRTAHPERGALDRALTFALLLGLSLLARGAEAQTWSPPRSRPPLFHIVAIDRSGELGWPYGREDVAGDGLERFDPDEAAADLRTVYADANAERAWLRAYVAGTNAPNVNLTVFFFLDSDARAASGGPATGPSLPTTLGDDPTDGGYERVIAVRGDGSALGAWSWDPALAAWTAVAAAPPALRGEAGLARDPLRILALDHAYVQAEVAHALSGLDATCGGRIFVRARYDGGPARSFGDDAREEAACRAPTDDLGDPEIVRSISCRADADCPAGGRCREGACLFAYDCDRDGDCRVGERCEIDRCVRVVDRGCVASAECDGLVCAGGRCVACAESGAAACAGGTWCSPNGSCVDADDLGDGVGRVQGGAFHCAAGSRAAPEHALGGLLVLALALGGRALRARRRRRGQGEGEVSP